VSEQTQHAFLRGLLLSVKSKVAEGHDLSRALSEHKEVFSGLICATVAAGERTGHLDKVLLRLADYTEEQWQIRQKIKSALIYPVMIVCASAAIVGFLLGYIVPKMVAVYANLSETLPLLTRILLSLSHVMRVSGIYIFVFLMMLIIGCRYALKKWPLFRYRWHGLLLHLPFYGAALKTAETARFARTLSILSVSGVPLVEAMPIAAGLITTLPIRTAVETAVLRVREGTSIYVALKQTYFFSPMSIHMMACGEASGQLEEMLDRIAINQENEVSRFISVALALFEPAIILIMGAVVLFIVLAVLLPIFQLNQFVS
jgi:general secretion pathway protein F